ncbi:hypothetical protein [Microbacterium sp. gxy059]|uniref:hypothetical protein n=1 Tax=Microbacterium sp. gxy059 TaxID=2957199 RepID=UPI003D95EB3D
MTARSLYALTAAPGGLHRIDLGTGRASLLAATPGEVPDGLVLDPDAGEAVVSFMGAPDGPAENGGEPPFSLPRGSVRAFALADGAERVLVERGSFTTGKQIARDPATGRLFWADREGRGIWSAACDGSDAAPLVLTAGRTPTPVEDECVGVAVDPAGGWLVWTQKGPSKGGRGRILRAPIKLPEGETAATRSDVEVLWECLPEPIDLELDADAGELWWTDRGAAPDGNTLNRAALPAPGERGEAPRIVARGFREAIGLAIDRDRNLAYVSDLAGRVHEVALATGRTRVVAELAGGVTGIALG